MNNNINISLVSTIDINTTNTINDIDDQHSQLQEQLANDNSMQNTTHIREHKFST